MDGTLLRDIALRTEGVFVPAGTSAIDIEGIVEAHIDPLVTEVSSGLRRRAPNEHYVWLCWRRRRAWQARSGPARRGCAAELGGERRADCGRGLGCGRAGGGRAGGGHAGLRPPPRRKGPGSGQGPPAAEDPGRRLPHPRRRPTSPSSPRGGCTTPAWRSCAPATTGRPPRRFSPPATEPDGRGAALSRRLQPRRGAGRGGRRAGRRRLGAGRAARHCRTAPERRVVQRRGAPRPSR